MSFEKLTEEFSASLYERKGKVIDFCIDEITLPNGQKAVREYIKHKGAAAVIPVDGEGNVYLVRQYRYAVGRETLEIPAGKLDSAGEDCREAAMRELREETGLCAKSLIPIGDYLGSPAINSEKIGLFLALEFDGEVEGSLDDDEFLNVVKMPLSELCAAVMRGEISDGKTAYAALWAERYIAGRGSN